MNFDDVENMTVATLKRELKTRNLPCSGIKSELVHRLTDFIANEEHKLLQTSSTSVGAGDELLDLPDELVLGLDTSLDSSIPSKGLTDKLLDTPTPPTVCPVSSSADISGKSKDELTSAIVTSTVEKPETDTDEQASSIKKLVQPPLSEEERKLLRAKKFNIPAVLTKEMRAKRFGLQTDNASTPIASSTSGDDKLKQRAERFGLTLSTDQSNRVLKLASPTDEKLKQRAIRFGVDTSNLNATTSVPEVAPTASSAKTDKQISEVLLKRKQRFGKMVDDNPEAKKMLRAERFGLK